MFVRRPHTTPKRPPLANKTAQDTKLLSDIWDKAKDFPGPWYLATVVAPYNIMDVRFPANIVTS